MQSNFFSSILATNLGVKTSFIFFKTPLFLSNYCIFIKVFKNAVNLFTEKSLKSNSYETICNFLMNNKCGMCTSHQFNTKITRFRFDFKQFFYPLLLWIQKVNNHSLRIVITFHKTKHGYRNWFGRYESWGFISFHVLVISNSYIFLDKIPRYADCFVANINI